MVEAIRPEEVIRSPVNLTDESLTERDLKIIEGSLNILIEDYSRIIPLIERNTESWLKASTALTERYSLREKEIISLPINDQVKELLLDLNQVLGRMIDYVNSQAEYLSWCLANDLLDDRFSEKRKDIQNALALSNSKIKGISFDEIAIKFASYQISLINTLYSLGSREVQYGARKERFSTVVARLLKGLLEKGIGSAGTLVYFNTSSGVNGALALCESVNKLGYRIYLPPAECDVRDKVDLIIGREQEGVMDANLLALQLKTKVGAQESRIMITDSPVSQNEDGHNDDWEKLRRFCQHNSSDRSWRDAGLKLLPKWCIITLAGSYELGSEVEELEVEGL